MRVLPLLLVAASVGLGNLAAAIGIGFGGVTAAPGCGWRWCSALFETGMPIVGLVIGAGVATGIGQLARWIGAGLLIVVGGVTLLRALRQPGWPAAGAPGVHPAHTMGLGKLIVTAFALSLDNLAAGFALGTLNISVAEAAMVIGAVSVLMSLAGLELGGRVGAAACRRGEQIGGAILVAVGVALAAGVSDRASPAAGPADRPHSAGVLDRPARRARPAAALSRPG